MNAAVRIVSYGSVQGELRDCGCKSHPKGGLAWRSAWQDTIATSGAGWLQLDLGNFAAVGEDSAADLKTRFLWTKMQELGVDAAAIGDRELSMWPTTEALIAGKTIPVINSNLTRVDGGNAVPVAEPYRILNRNGVRIAIFSLLGSDAFAKIELPAGVEMHCADPFETAAALVPKLQAEADLVVLMSEMGAVDTDRLLETIPGIDVALYGYNAGYVDHAEKRGETITQQTGTRGQYIGDLILILDPLNAVIDYESLNSMVDASHGIDEEMLQEVDDFETSLKPIEARARERRQGGPLPTSKISG